MKSLLLINFFLINFCNHFTIGDCKEKYSIKVFDYNYSMAYTTLYYLNAGNMTVKYISGIKDERDSLLSERKLSESECKMVWDFLSSHNINNLKNKYSNPFVDDGDRKRVIIQVNGKTKTIEIENFYQKDMGELFNIINKIVGKSLKIEYKPPPNR